MIRTCAMLGSILAAGSAWGLEGGDAITDPAKGGIDFTIQGEYVGRGGNQEWGAQVIAHGDGNFSVVGFKGGLPGAGWMRGDETRRAKGKLEGNSAVLNGDDFTLVVANGVMAVKDTSGNALGELKKVERKSPTLGAKPPAGAVVLFDGTSADQFENGKLVEGNLLGATNCASKQKLGNHRLHIEFRTPFMPKATGQGRGNSGVYIQGRYECQVLDSFGLDGKNNECGGIYSQKEPAVNMCLPPLSWQTYDIDFTAAKYDSSGKKAANARVSIKHNGVSIYENLEIATETPGFHKEGPGPDSLFLQDHGNPVVFRNIWVVEKK
ncbi:MAG: DUF1080 domain-containing protein [Planctomycetes bacterium]|nr:DUF1080 domain-containing protein [Planctomycetota bacterium]